MRIIKVKMSNDRSASTAINSQFISGCDDQINLIQYWANVDGIERLDDGLTRAVKFSIQEIPNDRYEEVISHMFSYFIIDEATCKSLSMYIFLYYVL
jgi:hypothetical protein